MAKNLIYLHDMSEDTLSKLPSLKEAFPKSIIIRDIDGNSLIDLLHGLDSGDRLILTTLSLPQLDELIIKITYANATLTVMQDDDKFINVIGTVSTSATFHSTTTKLALRKIKASGRRLGTPNKITTEEWQNVTFLYAEGVGVNEIARRLRISPSSVSRFLNAKQFVNNLSEYYDVKNIGQKG